MTTFSIVEARRFHRRAVLLDAPAASVEAALAHHGFIQIDPINVCGRMQDLILRNRVAGYREGDLGRYLHRAAGERVAFEHHLPGSNNLAAMPVEAWPFLQAAMRKRTAGESAWWGELDARQQALARVILAEMQDRGALCSDDIDDDQRDHQGWGAQASLAKTTLHKLFFHGRVLIAKREGQRRFYDLPERVLPSKMLENAEPSAADTARWVTLLKLRQRRLAALTRAELRHVEDVVEGVAIEGSAPLYCLREDLALPDIEASPATTVLLAPLDPLIYDRKLTQRLWGYDYTWEVYTPPAKRVRGYYALPVLTGTEIVGHIDPKADRAAGKLVVVNRSLRRGVKSAEAVRELTRFLGLKEGK